MLLNKHVNILAVTLLLYHTTCLSLCSHALNCFLPHPAKELSLSYYVSDVLTLSIGVLFVTLPKRPFPAACNICFKVIVVISIFKTYQLVMHETNKQLQEAWFVSYEHSCNI